MYSLDEILKVQDIYDFLKVKAEKINKAYIKAHKEIFGTYNDFYYDTITSISSVDKEVISFDTSETVRGYTSYDTCQIPMKYFLTDEYEEMIRDDLIALRKEREKQEQERILRELEEEARKHEKEAQEEYEMYLKLKEKYQK